MTATDTDLDLHGHDDLHTDDTQDSLDTRLERYRTELTGYCYRMLGSSFEAEDAVQDTMVRAWRAHDRFEGRSSLRSWLYRIATNVCLDLLNAGNRRARPMDLTEPQTAASAVLTERPEPTWLEPMPDGAVLPDAADPARTAVARESVRLAFVAALQHLPPKQRSVLILREVLAWRASEVAELLDTTVASVNSALQRARATLAAARAKDTDPFKPMDEEQRKLLERYVRAFEGYDMEQLTALLHEDAVLSMPPYDLWLRGSGEVVAWMLGMGCGCRGSRLLPTVANGAPAFGQYRPSRADPGSGAGSDAGSDADAGSDSDGGSDADAESGSGVGSGSGHDAWALQVLDISGGRIVGLTSFLDTARLFPLFGLPLHLDAG